MATSKEVDEITADRDRLQAENENLRGQLAAASVPARGPAAAQHTFVLTEGARQELISQGYTVVNGRPMSRAQVVDALGDKAGAYDLGTTDPDHTMPVDKPRTAIRGFDFVYPSVAPGVIDPAVAGTPGIHGPSADDAEPLTISDKV